MKCADFLRAIWPASGHYCLAVQTDHGLRHFWYDDIEKAAAKALDFDARGDTVYHACATFVTTESRKGTNAKAVRSLWVDLDVGVEEHKYPSVVDAAKGLKAFLEQTHLPTPWIIASGGGLHVYWPLDQELPVATARSTMRLFKRLAVHHAFKTDPSRTADMSSILRPVGTHNRKYHPPREVEPMTPLELVPFNELQQALLAAAKDIPGGVEPDRKKNKSVNAQFLVPVEYPPADADLVAENCAQMRAFKASRGNISEPVWYSGIEVLYHCVNGQETIHEWSKGHPNYSEDQTNAKIAQIKELGPTTCETFAARHPTGCEGCPHRGAITSPIQLGVRFTEAPAPPAAVVTEGLSPTTDPSLEFIPPPDGFTRNEEGIVHVDSHGVPTICYPYDLLVHEIAFDEAAKHEVTIVRHQLPLEGWMEFTFRSSAVASDRDFETAMRDNHVKPLNTRVLRAYVMNYMLEVQKAKKIRRLYSQMGWKDEMSYFVLGQKAFHAEGEVQIVGVSPSIKAMADGIRCRGSLETWAAQTEILNRPGMEAHALMFAAAPGAPLMRFTGFEGALFNAVGRSNAGKTSMARLMMSMYGDFNKLKLKQRDTENAKIQRIAALANLPAYVDEITNEDAKTVSDFVYEITQGRSKIRLKQDGTEREVHEWHTIVVSSSNTPLAGKLGVAKSNPEAERLRLFEFKVDRQSAFDDHTAGELFRVCNDNYGHAGERYVQHIVANQAKVRAGLEAFTAQLKVVCGARPEERMWMASLGCALYGLKLMRDLGLARVDVVPIIKWVAGIVPLMREALERERHNPLDILGNYLNSNASSRLSVRENGSPRKDGSIDYIVERYPTQEIHMRYDITRARLWVDKRHFRDWLVEHFEDYYEIEKKLLDTKVVVDVSIKKALGAHTGIGSTAVDCIEINMGLPVLGNARVQLVGEKTKEAA